MTSAPSAATPTHIGDRRLARAPRAFMSGGSLSTNGRGHIRDSPPTILFQHPPQQGDDGGRHILWQRIPVRFAAQDRGERLADVFAIEGSPAGQQSGKDTPEGPHVATLVDAAALGLLGRHVGRGAEDHPACVIAGVVIVGDIIVPSRRRDGFTVPWPDRSPTPSPCHRLELDVRRFQIAMDDSLIVRGFECVGNLPDNRERLVNRNGPRQCDRRASDLQRTP